MCLCRCISARKFRPAVNYCKLLSITVKWQNKNILFTRFPESRHEDARWSEGKLPYVIRGSFYTDVCGHVQISGAVHLRDNHRASMKKISVATYSVSLILLAEHGIFRNRNQTTVFQVVYSTFSSSTNTITQTWRR